MTTGEYESRSGSEYETDESGSEYETDSEEEESPKKKCLLESDQPVVQLLTSNGLTEYFAPLQTAGFDKPSTLVGAVAADLKAIGIKGGHAKRLLKLVAVAADIQAAAAAFKEAAAAAGVEVGAKPAAAAKPPAAAKPAGKCARSHSPPVTHQSHTTTVQGSL